jgi:L-ascorbate metabolism protein UlaG (beta-lactamase superfamily)
MVKDIDIILITHEHADHLHVGSLKEVLLNSPNAKVVTNSGVAKILENEKIKCEILEGNEKRHFKGLMLEAFDGKHEEIFKEVGLVQNTGYFIDDKFFYPGDSYCNPNKKIDVLALPVAGPWCRIKDAINYALLLKPNKAFPVHDGMLQVDRIGASHKVPEKVLSENGIKFIVMNEGDEKEF